MVRNPLSVLFYSRYPAELEEAEQWVVAFLSQLCLPDIATPQETIECWAEQRQGAGLSKTSAPAVHPTPAAHAVWTHLEAGEMAC